MVSINFTFISGGKMSTKRLTSRPESSSSFAQEELDKAEAQFEKFDQDIKSMTMDRMNEAPKEELEPQTKISNREIEKSNVLVLKPHRTLRPINPKTGESPKFNENFRAQYEYAIQYVDFIAENREIVGEEIELWTLPFPGMSAELWKVPVNKPVRGPRHLAEQIKRKFYHRLVMNNVPTEQSGVGTFYGSMAADTTIQRMDAYPVSTRKSIFMGTSNFK